MSAPEPRSPLHGALRPGRYGRSSAEPLKISERRLAIVLVQARKRQEAVLGRALELALPPARGTAATGDLTAIWIAPATWLVTAPRTTEGDLARRLETASAGSAAIVDQTHGKTAIRIAGAPAHDVLAKGCRVDLHPRVFGPGQTATMPVAHVACTLVQVDAAPTFDLIVPANLAQSFLEWLTASAAEFGTEIV